MTPLVSVVIPAYNEEKLLANCIMCLKKQDLKMPFEIIVVDNSSTDNTHKIAKSFDVRIVNENRQGVIFAKQAGLLASRGKIVAVTDADCEPPPNWLSKIYSNLSIAGVVGVGGPIKNIGGEKWHEYWLRLAFMIINLQLKLTGKPSYIMGGNVAFLRKPILDLGGYDTNIQSCGDELGLLETMLKKGKVNFDNTLINYTSPRRASRGIVIFFLDMIFYILRYYNAKYLKLSRFNYQFPIIR